MNYYNELDRHAAQWLRNLIAEGLIPAGDVDERSITEVKPNDIKHYTQCHFFAGIGGWPYALALAGIDPDTRLWTGSCPCQPFSAAGKQQGMSDERHLWPVWFNLIRECRPERIFGEQVESAVLHGWLDTVAADLEGEGYAFGAAVLGAHSVGAPHRRQRLYWVADGDGARREGTGGAAEQGRQEVGIGRGRYDRALADGAGHGFRQIGADAGGRAEGGGEEGRPAGFGLRGATDIPLGDTDHPGPQGRGLRPVDHASERAPWTAGVGFVTCTDGRKRLVKPGIHPLAHGFPGRVGLLRGSGNAIVPQVAAEFIVASFAAMRDQRATFDIPDA